MARPNCVAASIIAKTARVGLWCVASFVSAPAIAQELPNGPFVDERTYQEVRESVTKSISQAAAVGLVRSVELNVVDEVDGGCWTGASGAKARIRAELERSGIAVFEEPLAFRNWFSPVLLMSALGYRTNEGGPCVAFLDIEIYHYASDELGSLTYLGEVFRVGQVVTVWERSRIVSNGRNLDDQVMKFVQESVDALTGDIYSARRDVNVSRVLAVWNDDPPITQAEFEEMVRDQSP